MQWLIRQVAKICLRISDEMIEIRRLELFGGDSQWWIDQEANSIGSLNGPDTSIEGRAQVADDLTGKKWPTDGPV